MCLSPTSLSSRGIVAVPAVIIEQLQPRTIRQGKICDVEVAAVHGLLLLEVPERGRKNQAIFLCP